METGLVKIYATADLPRLRYIASVMLGDMLGLTFEIIRDKRKLGKHPVINYSDEKLSGSLSVFPCGLLHESGISERMPETGEWNSLPVFFITSADADIPFDIFAASFYLVSRYEEYNSHNRDEHGRYRASASLASRKGFLGLPLADLWARELAKQLVRKFKFLTVRRNEFSSFVTFDLDQPFAYAGKGLLRSVGGMIRDLGRKRGHAGERYKTVAMGEKDPYDVFDYVFETLDRSPVPARFFLPVGDHSRFDRNPHWKSSEYEELVKRIKSKYPVGIHPSYFAADDAERLKKEMRRLNETSGAAVDASRFHYLRLFLPASYLHLLEAGIKGDYSMGYAEEPGFRAGTSRPYRFYDLSSDKETSLIVFPFQVMDATLFQYKHMGPDEAWKVIKDLIDVTRKAGGVFSTIWHNTTLLDNEYGHQWRRVFEDMLNYQSQ